MKTRDLREHPLSSVVPDMQPEEFRALLQDIADRGIVEPIHILADGTILDGRHRHRAARELGLAEVPARVVELNGTSPEAYMIRAAALRRHLNESQRALLAARLANIQGRGRPDKNASIEAFSQDAAADALGVGRSSVQRAAAVLDDAAPEVVAEVEAGRLAVSAAAKAAKWPREKQRAFAKKTRKGVKPQEAARQLIAEEPRPEPALPSEKKYRVIYADPPWSYGNTSIDTMGEQRDHYRVMSLEEICAVPVAGLAEDNAVLFLWVTSPILEEAFEVVRAWGFKYKASFVWDKVKHVMGHYNSVRHEFLLVCVRGSCQPDNRKLFDSVVTEERTEHSRKPDSFYSIIETLYTYGARLELFARRPRDGWDGYGNEL